MNNKWLIGALLLAILAFLAGKYLGKGGGGDGKLVGPVQFNAVITIDQNGSCSQTVGGILTAYPFLRAKRSAAFGGDTIQWTGVDASGKTAEVVVTFPPTTPKGSPGTPFSSGGNPAFAFKSGQNSGPAPDTNLGDFPFLSESVGGASCTNPQFGGVHIDQ
jgi:hypothetical protein